MKTTNTVDAARVELLLSELRLPGIKLMWAKLAEQSDREGRPPASWRRLPRTKSPTAAAAGWSGISSRRVCPPAKRSPRSTSRPSQWCRKLR